jgi:glycosyltransferase involved in cell wall biosynthesis
MPKTFIIIPVYNEASRLDKEIFLSHVDKEEAHHLLFVNDGSSDQSKEVLDSIKSANPNQINVLHLEKNYGKAEAIRQGVLFIKSKENIDYFGYIDADLATPLSQVNYLCEGFNKNKLLQIIIGSRVQMIGYDIKRNLSRHYLGRIFATYVSLLFGLIIYDTQCGAKFFKASDSTYKLFEDKFTSRWFFDIEIFIRYRESLGQSEFEKSIKEIPLQKWHEQGKSKLKLTDFILSPIHLAKIKRKYTK